MVDELFELFGKKRENYLIVVSLPLTCHYYFSAGTNIKAWSDKNRFLDEVESVGLNEDLVENFLEKQSFLYTHRADFFPFNFIHKPSIYIGKTGQNWVAETAKARSVIINIIKHVFNLYVEQFIETEGKPLNCAPVRLMVHCMVTAVIHQWLHLCGIQISVVPIKTFTLREEVCIQVVAFRFVWHQQKLWMV